MAIVVLKVVRIVGTENTRRNSLEIFNAIAEQYDILQYFTRHPNLTEKTSSVFVMPEVEI